MSTHHGAALKSILKAKGKSVEDLAAELGVNRSTVYYWYGKDILDQNTVADLKKVGIDLNIVATKDTAETTSGNIFYVPIAAHGGFLTSFLDPIFMNSLQKFSLPGVTGEHYAFEIEGMSMYKKGDDRSMKPGDWAITTSVEKVEWMTKGKPYVIAATDGIVVKIFDRIDAVSKKAHFHSLNEEYDGIEIPLKSIKRAYFVSQILKKT